MNEALQRKVWKNLYYSFKYPFTSCKKNFRVIGIIKNFEFEVFYTKIKQNIKSFFDSWLVTHSRIKAGSNENASHRKFYFCRLVLRLTTNLRWLAMTCQRFELVQILFDLRTIAIRLGKKCKLKQIFRDQFSGET